MNYRHNLKYKYPERSDEHMIKVKHLRDTNFDENYPFLDKSFAYRFRRCVVYVILHILVFLVVTIRHGLRIKGRRILRKYKREFKDGAITIANHVFMWDYLCILKAIRPHGQYHPGWKINFEGPNGPLIRVVGGIPVPTDNIRAMAKFNKAIGEVLELKKWLHFFPEGSLWFYYPDVRPFKKAVFKYAVRYNKPIIPMGFTFRPRKGISRIFSKTPLVTLNIGEPIFPDKTLKPLEAIDDMHEKAYHVVQTLCGINPGDPTYNTDQTIENYKSTM